MVHVLYNLFIDWSSPILSFFIGLDVLPLRNGFIIAIHIFAVVFYGFAAILKWFQPFRPQFGLGTEL